jgi:transaldolase
MELYLDSVRLDEIKAANELGFVAGLTTTPTFMYRDGIKDIDKAILDISGLVNILQVEALGNNSEDIMKEARRLIDLGLSPQKTVFKIPVSLEGTKACKRLVDQGLLVNIHLVYTLQQAYMAFCAGATYVCPLVGRLQDQGHDALSLVEQCIDVVEKYGYPTKIMFSSVRHIEHVKNALNIGAHACTAPWSVIKQLTQNYFTDIGTQQFYDHTALLTTKVADVTRRENVFITASHTVLDALVQMSTSKLGAIIVMNDQQEIHRVFTDGDIRRSLQRETKDILHIRLSEFESKVPASIDSESALIDAQHRFAEYKVDNLVVMEGGVPTGILDIQDVIK